VGEDVAVSTAIPNPIPRGRTARRLERTHLRPAVRSEIERYCGSPVISAVSQGGGFTPGMASVLTCADGSHHFVKAASTAAQRTFAASYREEARKLRALPDTIPAPRLLWTMDGDWMVLGLEYVEAKAPRRPWRRAELDACLDTLEDVADLLTPAPAELELDSIVDELRAWPSYWGHINATRDLAHGADAAALAAEYAEGVAGETLVHTDVRDDNVLLTTDGRTLFCDWNWPTRGANWIDSLFMLIGPRGDGLDVEAVMAERRLLRDVPPEHVDRLLAVVCGYFLRSADEPVPPTSPYVREVQRWQGEVVWDWLSERRGWRTS
jgi:aminoglycoside phosphotransferase (APT) family kinase protein